MALVHLTKATCHRPTLLSVFPPQVSCHLIGPALLYCWHTGDNVGPTVNQLWAGVSCLLGGEVFSHVMLFDIIFYHRCRCEIPLLKDGVYNRGYFRVIIIQFHGTQFNKKKQTKRKINARTTSVNKKTKTLTLVDAIMGYIDLIQFL